MGDESQDSPHSRSAPPDPDHMDSKGAVTGTTAVRHAEKRRRSSCRFADRIAEFCVDHYKQHIPSSFREVQKQTCIAGVVALVQPPQQQDEDEDSKKGISQLYMLGFGVGTKFLSRDLLEQEMGLRGPSNPMQQQGDTPIYGTRVRDCHAEVLARRAFRRQLLLEIRQDLLTFPQNNNSNQKDYKAVGILERVDDGCYKLKSGVSLHMYASSAPCGNATVRTTQSVYTCLGSVKNQACTTVLTDGGPAFGVKQKQYS